MSNKEKDMLSEYKNYDYLNGTSPLVKILVNYIKPSFLYKTKILTPMHLGRRIAKEVSKDGVISDEDLKWLHENCIGDDDFEGNISDVNRRVGFLTGTYWAWKNYDKLGNPKYFGSFGYRRLFKPDFLTNLGDYDCIIPYRVDFSKTGPTVREHILKLQGEKTMNAIEKTLKKIHVEDYSEFCNYLTFTSSYMYEIYVMKKKLFFDFCEWIFPLMFELLSIPPEEYGFNEDVSLEAKFLQESGETRDVAYAIEILTGFYYHKLVILNTIKNKFQEMEYVSANDNESNRTKLMMKLLREKIKS